ncbi:MAG: gliding motility-associated C-terminal domain-containing protein [Saprospiraceae bacterium]
MNKQNKLLLLSFFLLFGSLIAQPSNDNCTKPIRIVNITKYCSKVGEFTNVDATPSGYGKGSCWAATNNDVWFVFRALASDVSITIIGINSGGTAGGTLKSMTAALYTGVCGAPSLNELACSSDNGTRGILSIAKGGLIVGQDYLLRIDGRNALIGTFQLCINNFFPPAVAEQDCRVGTVLCNNNPFVNAKLSGPGIDLDEARATCLGEGGGATGGSENQSTWYTWIAKSDCKLTFTITPLNPSDDIDFAVYELPSGIHNCNDKKLLRCNATHPTGPNGLFCGTLTGLNLSSTDTTENFNCDAGEDGFCKYIDMKAGKVYTIIINNFTGTGIGFSMEWGNCEFLGPEPEFKVVPDSGLRCETLFDVQDFSTFVAGNIVSYDWNFGVNAIPASAKTKGPHGVTYQSFGEKFITLTLTTDLGCKISKVKRIVAEPCCEDLPDLEILIDSIFDVKCFGEKNGRIVFHGNLGNPYTDQMSQSQYYTFSLDGIDFSPLTNLDNLPAGKYTLYIQDRKGCTNSIQFEIKEPAQIVVDAGPDVEIVLGESVILTATTQPSDFYTYDWSNSGIQLCTVCQSTTIVPLKEGFYKVLVTNDKGCTGVDSLFIRIRKEYKIFFPNVISPNDDNVNDFFSTKGNNALESIKKIEIYDRWGGRCYNRENVSLNDFDKLWDGKINGEKVNPGVFTYIVAANFIDGTTQVFSGDITVLR